MSNVIPQYSSLFHCVYDEQCDAPNLSFHYSVFRALDCRDVEQNPTALPYAHDFAVIWDDDHDTRIIHLLEEMLITGILPGVQFIGEHKGELNVILAAITYWKIDTETFADRLYTLSGLSAGDSWHANIGMYDRSSLRTGHQCDLKNLMELPKEGAHAYLFSIDSRWTLGTKRWKAADTPETPVPAGQFFSTRDRYETRGIGQTLPRLGQPQPANDERVEVGLLMCLLRLPGWPQTQRHYSCPTSCRIPGVLLPQIHRYFSKIILIKGAAGNLSRPFTDN